MAIPSWQNAGSANHQVTTANFANVNIGRCAASPKWANAVIANSLSSSRQFGLILSGMLARPSPGHVYTPSPSPLWNQRLTKGIPFDTLRIMRQFRSEQRENIHRVASRGQEKAAGGMHWRSFVGPDLGKGKSVTGVGRDSQDASSLDDCVTQATQGPPPHALARCAGKKKGSGNRAAASQPCLPGSVVGERSMLQPGGCGKVTAAAA